MPGPFDNLLNPDKKGTITGFLGGLMGVPNTQQQMGQAQGDAMSTLSDLFQQEGDAQRAFMKFVQTPQGQNLFMNDPKALETLANGLKAMQKPPTEQIKVGPGDAVLNRDPVTGATTPNFQNPTAATQTFEELAKIANLDDATKRQIAALNMLPKGHDGDAKTKALNALVTAGKISPEFAQKMQAGVFKEVPIRNANGEVIGNGVIDMSNGQVLQVPGLNGVFGGNPVIPSNMNNQAPGGQPQASQVPQAVPQAAPPGTTQGQQSSGIQPLQRGDQEILADPRASMALAAGVLPSVAGKLQGMVGQVDSRIQSPEARMMNQRQNAYNQFRVGLTTLSREMASGGMNVPKHITSAIDSLVQMQGVGSALTVGPREANDQLLALRKMADSEAAREEQTMRDLNTPKTVRDQSGERLSAYTRLQRLLPSEADLIRVGNMIDAGVGTMTPGSFTQDAMSQGKAAVQSGENQAGMQKAPDFATMDFAAIQKIDPKLLNNDQLTAYRNRLQQIVAESKKSKAKK